MRTTKLFIKDLDNNLEIEMKLKKNLSVEECVEYVEKNMSNCKVKYIIQYWKEGELMIRNEAYTALEEVNVKIPVPHKSFKNK